MPSRLSAAAIVHSTLLMAAFALLVLWPPRRGALLLIPLGGSMAQAVNAAVAGHATLLGRGPLPGSIVVLGDRGGVSAGIDGRAILLLAAAPAGCGPFAQERERS